MRSDHAQPVTFHKTPPVGLSAWHRQWFKGQLAGEVSVPCDDCSVCCSAFEYITLSDDDDPSAYQTRRLETGETVLAQHEGGSCIYLGEHGCRIYERRPAICRTFDCRMYSLLPSNDVLDNVLRWSLGPARMHAERLRDTAQQRFTFIPKEPDDHTFIVRFYDILLLLLKQLTNAAHGDASQMPDLSVILSNALMVLAGKKAARWKGWDAAR